MALGEDQRAHIGEAAGHGQDHEVDLDRARQVMVHHVVEAGGQVERWRLARQGVLQPDLDLTDVVGVGVEQGAVLGAGSTADVVEVVLDRIEHRHAPGEQLLEGLRVTARARVAEQVLVGQHRVDDARHGLRGGGVEDPRLDRLDLDRTVPIGADRQVDGREGSAAPDPAGDHLIHRRPARLAKAGLLCPGQQVALPVHALGVGHAREDGLLGADVAVGFHVEVARAVVEAADEQELVPVGLEPGEEALQHEVRLAAARLPQVGDGALVVEELDVALGRRSGRGGPGLPGREGAHEGEGHGHTTGPEEEVATVELVVLVAHRSSPRWLSRWRGGAGRRAW